MGENAVNRDKASDATSERLVERLEDWERDLKAISDAETIDDYSVNVELDLVTDAIAEIRRLREAEERMTKWRAETFDEMVRYREALERIRDGGGRCTETDDCPYCIATRALEEDKEESNG